MNQSLFQKPIDDAHRVRLTWQSVEFDIGEKKVIQNVSGVVNPGEIVALMGPSGCGKTTLLNLLSGRRSFLFMDGPGLGPGNLFKKLQLTGSILANGEPLTSE